MVLNKKHLQLLGRLFKVLGNKETQILTVDSMTDALRLHFPRYRDASPEVLEDVCRQVIEEVQRNG